MSTSHTHSPGPPPATTATPTVTATATPTASMTTDKPPIIDAPAFDILPPSPDTINTINTINTSDADADATDDARTPRTSPDPMPASAVDANALGTNRNTNSPDTTHRTTNDTPLPSFSFADILDVDPRPTLVLSLAAPVPRVVYTNPAFSSAGLSPLQDALWADLDANTATTVSPVTHFGYSWTQSILRNRLYAIISANQAVSEPAPSPTTATTTATAPEDVLLPPTPPASAVFLSTTSDGDAARDDTPRAAATAPTLDTTPGATPGETSNRTASFFPADGKDTNDRHAASADYLDHFEAITDFMPVGMCIIDTAGNIASANIAWHHIMGCAWPPPETDMSADGLVMTRDQFLSYVEDEDQESVQGFFASSTHVSTSTFGFRVKKYRLKESSKPQSSGTSTTLTPPTPMGPPRAVHAQDNTPPKKSASFPVTGSSSSTGSSTTPGQSQHMHVPRAPVRRDSLVLSSAASAPDEAARDSHVLATTHAELDADGNLLRVLMCLRDVTEHQHIAEAADRHARQANNLRRMAEFATVGMYDMDIDGRLRGANKVFYEMCGIQTDGCTDANNMNHEAVRPWIDFVADEDQPLIHACFQRLFGGDRNNVGKDNSHVDHWTVVEAGAANDDDMDDDTDDDTTADGEDESGDDDDTATKTEVETDYQTIELRFKTPWTTDDGSGGRIVAPRWVEASFLPVRDVDGKVQSITGCLTDISLRRWQLERERQVKEEAIESKRQQENFVDITSHEIRNPLTVIMHCGDAVLESLTRLREDVREDKQRAMLDEVIDSAEIIVSSALHQKSIVDDILTMSKLDSNLLAVTPVTVDAIEIVRSTLRMFEIQARQQHIQLRMVIDPSYYKELPVIVPSPLSPIPADTAVSAVTAPFAPRTPFLVFDPSRVKQILINLLTNALKFTQSVSVREVTTTVSISRTRPTEATCAVSFVPQPDDNRLAPAYGGPGRRGRGPGRGRGRSRGGTRNNSASNSPSPSSPSSTATGATAARTRANTAALKGESVFLIFEVRDTGEGLTDEGVHSLFQKFVQADSSTHVKHGGSGLGLFISKRLAEIQNGSIGVASACGLGSTFVFYIEAFIPPPSAVPEILSPGEAAKIALAAGLGNAAGGTSVAPVAAVPGQPEKEGAAPRLTAINVASLPPSPLAITPTIMSPVSPQDAQQVAAATESKDRSDSDSAQSAAMHAMPDAIATDFAALTSADAQTAPPTPTTATPTPIDSPMVPARTSALAFSPSLTPTGAGARLATVPATPPEIHGVLLVEDNIVNQKVTRRYFEKLGFNVEVAANGVEAMASIRASDRCVPGSFPISVVLMDMEMPVQDGLTCTRHIRALEAGGAFAGGRMPVLMITGNARAEQIADARAAGCDDVVVKPFQMHLLFEHIKLVMHTLWVNEIRALEAGAVPDAVEAVQELADEASLAPVLDESKTETKTEPAVDSDTVKTTASPQLHEGAALDRPTSD